ncbi:MAG: FHA domain-containing protein [Polyangiaceae bacterium]|jgi:pSer/pThr/pTyr-binding forkhead associated (FHA) protein
MAGEDHLHLGTGAGLEDFTFRTLPTDRHARTFHVAYLEPLYSRGARIRLDVEPVTVGRSSSCTVRLEDPRVSARHALFQFTETGVLVTDLGSTNGILVDGHRMEAEMRVTTTAIVTVGRTRFRLLVGDELSADGADDSPKEQRDRLIKDRVVCAYQDTRGNLSQTARLVGFDRKTVRDWLRQRGVYREPEECNRRPQGPIARTTKR